MDINTSKTLIISFIFNIMIMQIFAQESNSNKGYWDKENIITQTLSINGNIQFLNNDDSKKILDFELPTGTTKILYKITVLQKGSKALEPLKNLLSTLSFVSNEAKVASSLLSISNDGSNNCYYSIFSSKEEVLKYQKNGINGSNPCYKNNNKISTHTNVLNENNLCLSTLKYNKIYFGIKNTNLYNSTDIYVEVMPWIDKKKKTGWNQLTKQNYMKICVNSNTKIPNKEKLCLCILDKIIENYSVDEYNSLLKAERIRFYEANEVQCNENTGINEQLTEQKQNEQIIILIEEIIRMQ